MVNLNTNKKYRILVRNLNNIVITFNVSNYEVVDGFVCFVDEKTNIKQMFAVSNCEIKEVVG